MKVEVETWSYRERWSWRVIAEGAVVAHGEGMADDNQALQVALRRATHIFNRSGR